VRHGAGSCRGSRELSAGTREREGERGGGEVISFMKT